MNKRYLPITIVCVVLALIALAGYLRPASTQEMPVRLLFDNKGGDVVFSHSRHATLFKSPTTKADGIPCAECHHESDQPSATPVPCATCHPAEYDAAFVAEHQAEIDPDYCGRCHHAEMGALKFDHQEHIDSYTGDCTDCHHDTDIEPEPQACGDCHMDEGDEVMPGLRDASHIRCSACHDDPAEMAVQDCGYCHQFLTGDALEGSYTACATCHYSAQGPLLPNTMAAFHDGCMGCHEAEKVGPFGDNACNRCHTR